MQFDTAYSYDLIKCISPETILYGQMHFVRIVFSKLESLSMPLQSVSDTCEFAFKSRSIFPTVYKVAKLLYTAPVSVAKDERTFSKMKIIKNCLRSTMTDERLEDLIVLATEKDLTDKIDLEMMVNDWSKRKNRELKLKLTGQKYK